MCQAAVGTLTRLSALCWSVFICAATSAELPPVVFVQVPIEAAGRDLDGSYTPRPVVGSQIVLFNPGRRNQGAITLTPDFLGAQDPEVSFDGQRILFAGKKTESDSWDIWEMNADGSGKRRVVNRPADDFQPVYTGCLNTLDEPEWDQILLVSTAPGTLTENGEEKATALYSCKLDGTYLHRISYNLSSDFDPFILQDGRVVFTSWQQNAGRYPPDGLFPLFVMCTDGTDLMPFYGNHEMPRIKRMARETFDRHVVFVESDQPGNLSGGRLARVSMRRNLHSHEVLDTGTDGRYHSPCPLPGGNLLVSYRPAEGSTYGIYRFDMEQRRLSEVIFDDPRYHDLDAQLLAARQRPRGRSTVVDYSRQTGIVYCLDCYESDRPGIMGLPKGSVKRLRVIEGLPVRSASEREGHPAGFGPRRILGDIPVEEDGSFSIEVPARTPLCLQTLDENGSAIATLGSWFWVMPRERRGCIGCHEDRERTPPNRFVDAVKRRPTKLTLPPERRRTTGFKEKVWPILRDSCLECHTRPDVIPSWRGEPEELYQRLLEGETTSPQTVPLVQPGRARGSRLIWAVFAKRLEGPGKGETFSPTHHRGVLNQFERQTLVEWVDLGAPWESPVQPAAN